MLRFVIISILCIFTLGARAQNVCRYWFDRNESAQKTITVSGNTEFSIDISNLAPAEMHSLHVQVCNSVGDWGPPMTSMFYLQCRETEDVTARYWYDRNESAQKTITVSGETELNIDISSLAPAEMHSLHVQVCNSAGLWGPPMTNMFYLQCRDTEGTTARYWYDTDEENQQRSSFKNSTDLDIKDLPSGLHSVHYQMFGKDGTPSSVMTERFMVRDLNNERLSYLLWIDDAQESAKIESFTTEEIIVNIRKLSIGTHKLNVALFDEYYCLIAIETQEFEVEAGKEYIKLPPVVPAPYTPEEDLDFSKNPSLKAYIASGYDVNNEAIQMIRVYKVPAGTGLVLMGEANKTYEVALSNISYVYANMLNGITQTQTVPMNSEGSTNFVIKDDTHNAYFYPLTEDTEMDAGTVYLTIPSSLLPSSGVLKMVFIEGGLKGDVNEDGEVNVADHVELTNIIMNQE